MDLFVVIVEKKDKSLFKFIFFLLKLILIVLKFFEIDKDGMYINKEGEDDYIFFESVI